MHTRWSITIFLFFGVLSAGMTVLPAIRRTFWKEIGLQPYRLSNLAAAFCAFIAVAAVTLSLNDPAKLINILGRPAAGLSSAIIAQILVLLAALYNLGKGSPDKRGLHYVSAAVALYAVFCLFHIYMISTRPALNTPILLILLLLVTFVFSLLAAALFPDKSEDRKKQSLFLLAGTILCGICLILFVMHLLYLPKGDRIFSFAQLTTGIYAPLFWISLVFLAIVPALYARYGYHRQGLCLPSAVLCIFLFGLFTFCGLVNQMPAIVHGRILH